MAFSNLQREEVEGILSSYLQKNGIPDIGISATQLQSIYHNLRPGNSISLHQVAAAIETICFCDLCLKEEIIDVLRWLDTVFQGQYLPRLSINYVAINKDLEKLTPQLY